MSVSGRLLTHAKPAQTLLDVKWLLLAVWEGVGLACTSASPPPPGKLSVFIRASKSSIFVLENSVFHHRRLLAFSRGLLRITS